MEAVGLVDAPALEDDAFFAFIAFVIVRRPGVDVVIAAAKERALTAGIAVVTGALAIWAVYSFSFGRVAAWGMNLPAPELFDGVAFAMYHNTKGHAAYFMGEIKNTGWWYFFPVLLLLKTPLAWLVLAAFGVGLCLMRRAQLAYWMPLAFAAGILCLVNAYTHFMSDQATADVPFALTITAFAFFATAPPETLTCVPDVA